MTEQGHDQSGQAVEESLDSWAAPPDASPGWVEPTAPPPAVPDPDAVSTRVHQAETTTSAPVSTPAAVPEEHAASEQHAAPAPTPPTVPVVHAVEHADLTAGELPPAVEFSPSPAAAAAKLASDRPEFMIAGAFVGGLLLASILKRLAR